MNLRMAARAYVYRQYLIFCSLAAACLMALAPVLVQAEIVADVRFVSGLVTADAPAKPLRELAKGDGIENASRIDTSANSRIQMRFTDGGLVSLMPESTFSVEEYKYDQADEDDGALVFGLLRGGLRTMTGAIGKTRHEDYQLNTPIATLGIRGTEYTAVLNPPNTLRVHVGRGKVVITNKQGELEVPAGRNAVVTLGSAPAFSEQEPLYLATSPGGLLLAGEGEIRQDIFIGPPLVDLDILPTVAVFDPAPGSSQPVAPPPTVTPPVIPPVVPPVTPPVVPPLIPPVIPPIAVLPDGLGYSSAGITQDGNGFPVGWDAGTGNLTGVFDANSGGVLSLETPVDGPLIPAGAFQTANVTTVGALSWGEFTDGTSDLGGQTVALSPSQFLPYLVGESTAMIPAGTLQFSLDGATPVRGGDGLAVLDRFNLDLTLGGAAALGTYSLDMQLIGSPSGPYNALVTNQTLGSETGAHFGFNVGGGNISNCTTACSLDVQGFLAGPTGEQAGVTYIFEAGQPGGPFYGAAGLKQ